MRGWQRPAVVVGGSVALVACAAAAALAVWSTPPARVDLAARAASMPAGRAPDVQVTGPQVRVSWAPPESAGGLPVRYRVIRYALDGTRQQLRGGCAAVVDGTRCVDSGVSKGTWVYTVQPVLGNTWNGRESDRSAPVAVHANGPDSAAADAAAPTADPSPGPGAEPGGSPSGSASASASGSGSASAVPATGASASASAGPVPRFRALDVQAFDADGVFEDGDRVVFTFDGPVDPASVAAGWDGRTALAVAVSVSGPRLTFLTTVGPLALGAVTLGAEGYPAGPFPALLSTGGNTVTVTLTGGPSPAPAAVPKAGTLEWTPGALRGAGGAALTGDGVVRERGQGPADVDF